MENVSQMTSAEKLDEICAMWSSLTERQQPMLYHKVGYLIGMNQYVRMEQEGRVPDISGTMPPTE